MKQLEDELNAFGYGLDPLTAVVGVGIDASHQCSSSKGCVPGCATCSSCQPGCSSCTTDYDG